MGKIRGLAVASALATFLLVVIGGIVRVYGPDLGCSSCQGSAAALTLLPSFVETIYRVVATLALVLVSATAIDAWARFRQYKWVIVPSILALGLLALQFLLDAFPSSLEAFSGLMSAHLDSALLLFAAVVVAAAGARWATQPDRRFAIDFYAGLAIATSVLTYVLLR